MQLSDLASYAMSKYQIQEDHKWPEFPGFSVLCNPATGKWVALLMRQWDTESGTEIERCDIKCGQFNMYKYRLPWFSAPYRMKGSKWLGVAFDNRTKPQLVYQMFDLAMRQDNKKSAQATNEIQPTIVLESLPLSAESPYKETKIIQPNSVPIPKSVIIPQKILQMKRLYEPGDGSFLQKCKNFYNQGMFMKDYEDDLPYHGNFRLYFPSYHDLEIEQLRGYFTWRTWVRNGEYKPICLSLAYIYIYELLNGIGTSSPEDSLQKMHDFEAGFLDAGYGDDRFRELLRKWMFEFIITHHLSAEIAIQHADPKIIRTDLALDILRHPDAHTDEAVFKALCDLTSTKISTSSVIKKKTTDGIHLFAEVWRYALAGFEFRKKDLFETCFGQKFSYNWNPLSNAVYWNPVPKESVVCRLNTNRKYECQNGLWREECYQNNLMNLYYLNALLHEADRRLRLYLCTGTPLKEKRDEAWTVPYINAVIAVDAAKKAEAAKPQINIQLANLEQIRIDAADTRDKLLTDEEIQHTEQDERRAMSDEQIATSHERRAMSNEPIVTSNEQIATSHERRAMSDERRSSITLDNIHFQILYNLLNNKPINSLISTHHLMISIVADTINEAFFDEIGDNILDCDGDSISVIEDYRGDVERLLQQ